MAPRWARGKRGQPWILANRHACCLLLALWPSRARAESEGPPDPHARRGFSFDLRLGVGGAHADFSESDRPVAEFASVAVGGSARFGWFLGPQVLLGAELGSSWHSGVGSVTVWDAPYFGAGVPSRATYCVIVPLGVFVEVYPWLESGWFVAVGGGVGWMDLPRFSDGNGTVLTSGFSLDVGYELSARAKRGPALFARYSRWAGEEFIVSDHPDGLVSRELLVGLRWSFWTPVWQ